MLAIINPNRSKPNGQPHPQVPRLPRQARRHRPGIMTCQRVSDTVRMGPEHRDGHNIWCRPKKTRKRRRAFIIPLTTADALELDRWAEAPVEFTNSRWKKPIERFRDDLFLYSPKGAPYTPDSLRARLVDGSRTPKKVASSAAAARSGSPRRSRNTNGISTPRTRITRPSTDCAVPASWPVPS
jgi:integrase